MKMVHLSALLLAMVLATPLTAAEIPDDDAVVARGTEVLLGCQEGEGGREWPYEGVYRVKRKIPIGYRVGGTAICAMSLMAAAGYDDDAERHAAIDRATSFIIESINAPLMGHDVTGRYDVRGWGYTYGLTYLLAARRQDRLPAARRDGADEAIRFFIAGIEATEIPEIGGWNYSRSGGFDQPGPSSPFMTAPTLLALYDAVDQGFAVDGEIIERGLNSLERGRTPTGAFDYSAGRSNRRSRTPGAVGRMAASEAALYLAGRATPDRLRGAVDAFLVHWGRLEERRSKTGTHEGPFGIAPYYFFFAHYYAALAIELLPTGERDEYRQRLRERLAAVRAEDGSFNDRVFDRSANYGTAMAILALRAPNAPSPARWKP